MAEKTDTSSNGIKENARPLDVVGRMGNSESISARIKGANGEAAQLRADLAVLRAMVASLAKHIDATLAQGGAQ
jgi:hypothetical protein